MVQKSMKSKAARSISPRSMYSLMLAAVVYMSAAYIGLFTPSPDEGMVSMLVAIGTAMVAVSLVRAWQERNGEPLADERTILVHRIAVNYSWWASYVVIAVLLLVQQFKLATLSVEGVLSLVFFTMIASLILFRFYISKREAI
ncbi:MAG: hypothetical protein WC861_01820 [Candidatus Micrarchaeia archaeon]|jgi:hypothetical protein